MNLIPLKIEIATVGGKPIFTDCQPSEAMELVGVGIIEKATAAQRTGVTLILKHNGKYFHAQTTARLFVAAASAVKGAQERFGDE